MSLKRRCPILSINYRDKVLVADTFCAMVSNRPCHKAYKSEDAMRFIEQNSGILFDVFAIGLLKKAVGSSAVHLYDMHIIIFQENF